MINGNGYAIIANPEGNAWEFAKEIYSKMLEIDKKRKKDSKNKRDTLEGKIEMIEITTNNSIKVNKLIPFLPFFFAIRLVFIFIPFCICRRSLWRLKLA